MTQFFKSKELPLSKKVFDQLATWIEKQRAKADSQAPAQADGENDAADANRSVIGKVCNPYAIRSCLEALWYSYGHTMTPELPSQSLYKQQWQRDMSPTGVIIPKIMFTVFNGGKAL